MSDTTLAYSILGGCVTRDAGDLGAHPLPKPIHYFSRSRIQSIVSTPSPVDPRRITLESNYQRRVIIQDHDKTVARVLSTIDHPLIIDLVGERSPLAHTGHGIITASQYFVEAGLSEDEGVTPVANDQELADDGPFATAAHQFADILPQQTVVIHRAFWAMTDIDGESLRKRPLAERSNEWLARAYDLLQKALGDRAVTVEPAAEHRVADPAHRWGAAPFHFPPAYYTDLSGQIRAHLRPRIPSPTAR